MRSNQARLAASVSVLVLAALTATVASAQSQPSTQSGTVSEVIVTGSLVPRPNNTSVSPIVTVGQQAIEQTGQANLEDVLDQLPSFTTGGNAATGGQGQGGRAEVNLHGLGTNRNLVLLDGRRLPLSDVNGNVDINILPTSIISSVDVITGGASAVYGSDAMSGVVNFKTIRSFEGVRAEVQDSISEQGDANRFDGSIALGIKSGDDRGHLIAAFSYSAQDPVTGASRPFFHSVTPSSYLGTGTFVPSALNAPSAAVEQTLFTGYGVAGARNPLLNLGFNNDGSLYVQTGAVNYRGPTDGNGYEVIAGNVRMPVGQQGDILNGLKRKGVFVKGDYDLAPGLTAYGQFMYVDLDVHTNSGGSLTQFGTLTTVPVTNPFVPADLSTVLASRPSPNAPFTWNGRYVGVPWKNWDENYIVQQYLLGLKGDIAPGWSFDLFGSYDTSDHTQVMHDAVVKARVQTLLNAADGGNSICAGGFNPFGDANARSLSQACINYITKNAVSTEKLGQIQAQGQINGKLFDLGAGPVQLGVVGDYRRNDYNYVPDSDLEAQNLEAVVASQPSAGVIDVKELAGQLDIPLLKDKPFAEEFGVGVAARVSDYSTSGTVVSYEADARWRPIHSLLFRGSFQRAVRAPNIGELFSPAQGTQLVIGTPPSGLGDPCDVRSTARTGANGAQVAALCQAQGIPAAAISSYIFPTTATGQTIAGNTGLTPERANTYNLGLVWNAPTPSMWFSELSLSLDYYNINITNVISSVPGLTVLSKCYDLDGSNPSYDVNNAYCKLIQRDINGQLVTVATPYLNLGGLKTDGLEFQLNWSKAVPILSQNGRIFLTSDIGWLHSYEVQLLPGSAFVNYTGVSNGGGGPSTVPPVATPRWKAVTSFGYRTSQWSLGMRWRYQSPMADISSVLTPSAAQVGVSAYNLWDLYGTFAIAPHADFRAGVNNLFDRGLPVVSSSQNSTLVQLYDAVGRSFYVGMSYRF
ncbi:MAG TPA: TonB-dependent receptor [Caulobacteraceae bacterium]